MVNESNHSVKPSMWRVLCETKKIPTQLLHYYWDIKRKQNENKEVNVYSCISDLYEMSLFKAREWWYTTVGEEEDFDQGCLCVANIDNSTNELG